VWRKRGRNGMEMEYAVLQKNTPIHSTTRFRFQENVICRHNLCGKKESRDAGSF
jgi:hypothetical protein